VSVKHKQMSFVSNGGKFKLYTVPNGLHFKAYSVQVFFWHVSFKDSTIQIRVLQSLRDIIFYSICIFRKIFIPLSVALLLRSHCSFILFPFKTDRKSSFSWRTKKNHNKVFCFFYSTKGCRRCTLSTVCKNQIKIFGFSLNTQRSHPPARKKAPRSKNDSFQRIICQVRIPNEISATLSVI
jgi:hypothetical protein